jgi:tetratricopeptide (TPR) repeat protein
VKCGLRNAECGSSIHWGWCGFNQSAIVINPRSAINPQSAIRNPQYAVCASVVFLALAQNALPPLPRLSLDTYPAAAREAISRAHRDATVRSSDADAVGTLGRVLHAWEQWEGAHQAYARAQALAPRAFDWLYLDAVVLQRLARHAESASRLRQALAASPGYLPARVKLAESLFEAGDLGESRRMFEALAREPAAEPAAEFGLGRIAAAEGQHDAAITHLQRAVTLFPEWGAAHYALALSYRAAGRRDEAQRALERHARYGSRWPALDDSVLAAVNALRDDARASVQRGVKLADRGELEAAIAAHEAALVIEPSLAEAHANLIALYGRAANFAKAEEHYRAVVALGVNLSTAHYDYGVLLGLQEKWDLAAEAYRRAIAVNPMHAPAQHNLGQILERQRQFEAAADAYRGATESQPSFRLARFNLGRMLLALGQTELAIAELGKLTEPRDAEAPRYLFALATAHIRAGQRELGIKWATDARQLALAHGQDELAAAIARDLASLK